MFVYYCLTLYDLRVHSSGADIVKLPEDATAALPLGTSLLRFTEEAEHQQRRYTKVMCSNDMTIISTKYCPPPTHQSNNEHTSPQHHRHQVLTPLEKYIHRSSSKYINRNQQLIASSQPHNYNQQELGVVSPPDHHNNQQHGEMPISANHNQQQQRIVSPPNHFSPQQQVLMSPLEHHLHRALPSLEHQRDLHHQISTEHHQQQQHQHQQQLLQQVSTHASSPHAHYGVSSPQSHYPTSPQSQFSTSPSQQRDAAPGNQIYCQPPIHEEQLVMQMHQLQVHNQLLQQQQTQLDKQQLLLQFEQQQQQQKVTAALPMRKRKGRPPGKVN